ncbi:hypothetical protein L2E82_35667 [Cichorium intybus]|uniref:Uncharacterized protein n=1 Tax=Cichorium intybus TaxID=13427 RepID=A0ACB9BPH2_CICIN|nr:hypothetical protein L2E82_35667 [Cichorium intybus]
MRHLSLLDASRLLLQRTILLTATWEPRDADRNAATPLIGRKPHEMLRQASAKSLDCASNFSGLTGWIEFLIKMGEESSYSRGWKCDATNCPLGCAKYKVVVAMVLFVEVPDLGSIVVAVVTDAEPILRPHPHNSAQPPDTGAAAVEVVVDMVVVALSGMQLLLHHHTWSNMIQKELEGKLGLTQLVDTLLTVPAIAKNFPTLEACPLLPRAEAHQATFDCTSRHSLDLATPALTRHVTIREKQLNESLKLSPERDEKWLYSLRLAVNFLSFPSSVPWNMFCNRTQSRLRSSSKGTFGGVSPRDENGNMRSLLNRSPCIFPLSSKIVLHTSCPTVVFRRNEYWRSGGAPNTVRNI